MSNRLHTYRDLDAEHHKTVIMAACSAFWRIVADSYITGQGGDLSPETSVEFDQVAEKAINEWVAANVPTRSPLGDAVGAVIDIISGHDGKHQSMHWGVEPEPSEDIADVIHQRGWTAKEVLFELERAGIDISVVNDYLRSTAANEALWFDKRTGVAR